jgi:hypothetical protein
VSFAFTLTSLVDSFLCFSRHLQQSQRTHPYKHTHAHRVLLYSHQQLTTSLSPTPNMHLTHHHNNMMTVLEASSSTTSWHHQPTMAASKSKQVKPSTPHVENKEEQQSLDGYKRGLFCDDRDMTCIMMFKIIYGLGVWVVGENVQEGFGVFIFGLPPVLEPDFDLLWLNVGQHRRLTDELLSSDGAGLGTLMIHPLQCLHLLVCVPHILPRGIHPTTSPLPFWSSLCCFFFFSLSFSQKPSNPLLAPGEKLLPSTLSQLKT